MKKRKTLIVGLGRLGKLHAANLANRIPELELIAVCSDRQSEIDAFRADVTDGVAAYLDFDEMLREENEAEAIVIASSSQAHEEHLGKSLAAGLHVFMEKPFGVDPEQTRRMYNDVVRLRGGRTFYLGYNRRCDPSYMHMKKLLDAGKIGAPFIFRCTDNDPLIMAAGIVPGRKEKGTISAEYAKTSGGLFYDFTSHSYDIIRSFFGSEAKTIYAKGAVNVIKDYGPVGDYDTAAVVVELENGILGLLQEGRTCIHGYQVEMEITGTRGALRLGTVPERNLVTIFDDTGAVRECSDYFLERFERSFEIELHRFADAIDKGENGWINEEDGLRAAMMAYATKLSAKEKREVTVSDLYKK